MNRRFATLALVCTAFAVGCNSNALAPTLQSAPAPMADQAAQRPGELRWGERARSMMQLDASKRPAPSARIAVYVQVKMRDAAGLVAYAAAASTPGNSDYRNFLTPAQIQKRFGASAFDYNEVAAYFHGFGMRVDTWPQREVLRISGTLPQMTRAFNTDFAIYSYGHRTGIAPRHTPRFSRTLPVTAVVGLVDFPYTTSVNASRQSFNAFSGYTPQQLARGFDYSGAYAAGYTGKGIVTGVLATGPTNPSDFAVQAATYGYPLAPVVAVTATPPSSSSPYTSDQGGEPAIDTQNVAELAPKATEQFVFDGGDGMGELQLAIAQNAVDTVSYSAGAPEQQYLANDNINTAGNGPWQIAVASLVAEGIAFFASSGDNGSTTQPCSYTYLLPSCVTYPASDVNAVAVGAVNTPLDDAGNLDGEITAWSVYNTAGVEPTPGAGSCNCIGSGGGYSVVEKAPSWQAQALGISASAPREIPDMSMDGDPKTGGAITINGAIGNGNGTSMAAPMANAEWALVLAACKMSPACSTAKGAKPYRLGNPAPLLYGIYRNQSPGKLKYAQVFYDVIYGNNQPLPPSPVPSISPPPPVGYSAGPGYDLVTGLGVPFVGHLIDAVVKGAGAP